MISKQTGLTWKKDFPKALRSLLFEEPSYFNLTVKNSKALGCQPAARKKSSNYFWHLAMNSFNYTIRINTDYLSPESEHPMRTMFGKTPSADQRISEASAPSFLSKNLSKNLLSKLFSLDSKAQVRQH